MVPEDERQLGWIPRGNYAFGFLLFVQGNVFFNPEVIARTPGLTSP
jgi:hypothetical protein